MESFTMKSYGLRELAMLYLPGVTASSASRRLKHWIQIQPNLLQELTELGWTTTSRILTPLQVEIIIKYLGQP